MVGTLGTTSCYPGAFPRGFFHLNFAILSKGFFHIPMFVSFISSGFFFYSFKYLWIYNHYHNSNFMCKLDNPCKLSTCPVRRARKRKSAIYASMHRIYHMPTTPLMLGIRDNLLYMSMQRAIHLSNFIDSCI